MTFKELLDTTIESLRLHQLDGVLRLFYVRTEGQAGKWWSMLMRKPGDMQMDTRRKPDGRPGE